jgi:hypothetical protein
MQLAKKQFKDQNKKKYITMWNVKSMHNDFCYNFSHNIQGVFESMIIIAFQNVFLLKNKLK